MTTAVTHFRYEIVRSFRNRIFYAVTLALPLVLFYAVATGQRHATFDGIRFPLYFMTAMAVYGAMFAAVSPGARIARDRSGGWTRQVRLTPLRASTDIAAKVLTAYLIALPSVVLVFLAGASLGVRLSASQWLEIGGLLLVGLTPFIALGIVLGYLMRADTLAPAMGGIVVLFALVGGVYGFQLAHSGPLFDVMKAIPSYWLVQAGKTALGGGSWPAEGWIVIAAWTVGLVAIASLVYRRSAARG
jgi:ABC-2 type transport system permease protein